MLATLLLLTGLASAACPDVRDCQTRASSWEDGAWFGVGIGWAGLGTAFTLGAIQDTRHVFNFGAPTSLVGFGLSVPLMAAAASPSRRAVELSENTLSAELRRRPRYWTMYVAGMVGGAASVTLIATRTGPWWVAASIGVGSAGVLTGSAAGFARDARWIRRQAPIATGRPRRPSVRLVPTGTGARLHGTF